MPTYDIRCPAGHEHEVFAKFRDVTPCPTCGAETQRIWKGSRQVIGDEWPGGKTFEHITHEPITVYSKTELKRVLDAHGLRHTDRLTAKDIKANAGRWIDPYTLANAQALAARQGPPTQSAGRLETLTVEIRDVGVKP